MRHIRILEQGFGRMAGAKLPVKWQRFTGLASAPDAALDKWEKQAYYAKPRVL
jgi:hypothetical protein